jgi:pilus assembly protein FimV
VRFTVEDIEGDAYLSATSNLPVGDPVLRFIVEVNWSSGRMLREYTLFLDPPAVPAVAPAPRVDRRSVTAPPPPVAQPEPAPAASPKPAVATAATAAPAAASEYGPVRSGETLWGIANEWSRGSGLSVNQVMIAIQRENPNAFMQDNINLLKRGAILRMPRVSDVEQISSAAAYREVVRQAEAFSSRRETASVASPATPLLADDRAAVAAEEQPEAVQEPDLAAEALAEGETGIEDEKALAADEAAAIESSAEAVDTGAAAAEPEDLLELVPPSGESELDSNYGFEETDEAGGAEVGVQSLRENLARTEEELINQQQQNTYLEERIQELEAELEAANKAQVPDPDLANMEDRLREQRVAQAQAKERREPWYSHLSVWLVGLLVMLAAFAGWLLSRRGRASAQEAAAEESLRSIQNEAEDVLRVLADEPEADAEGATAEPESAGEAADQSEAEGEAENEAEKEAGKPERRVISEDAELLDEESSDPEIQLDLARAYISMGDKEAARVILEEVLSNGSEEQQSEARKMLDLMA